MTCFTSLLLWLFASLIALGKGAIFRNTSLEDFIRMKRANLVPKANWVAKVGRPELTVGNSLQAVRAFALRGNVGCLAGSGPSRGPPCRRVIPPHCDIRSRVTTTYISDGGNEEV